MAAPGDSKWRILIEECFRREAGSDAAIPGWTTDLIETGALDSMAWVSFVRTVESASGVSELGSALTERSPSLESVFLALEEVKNSISASDAERHSPRALSGHVQVSMAGSSAILGSRKVSSEEVDRAFGMPVGKLRTRAGIESLAYAADGENELTLGARAAQECLRATNCGVQELDWILVSSETNRGFPSLAAQLHSQLLVRETCGALDIGGACLGLLNALAVGQALLASGRARTILVVTADVHSRILVPGRVTGEFGGLFGDGASAFLLRTGSLGEAAHRYCLGEFFFGCAGQYAGAIRVSDGLGTELHVHFDGEGLSRVAIARLEKVIADVELRSGIARTEVQGLATHQPNPRLMDLLAKQCGLPVERFPAIAKYAGNLGASTCGAALNSILQSASLEASEGRKPIFLASLGPGLLFGGGWLIPA